MDDRVSTFTPVVLTPTEHASLSLDALWAKNSCCATHLLHRDCHGVGRTAADFYDNDHCATGWRARRHLGTGLQGLMHKRQEPRGAGGPNCFECTIAVDDLDAVTNAIAKHGDRACSNICARQALRMLQDRTRNSQDQEMVLGVY